MPRGGREDSMTIMQVVAILLGYAIGSLIGCAIVGYVAWRYCRRLERRSDERMQEWRRETGFKG
jgi:hypothetical protein